MILKVCAVLLVIVAFGILAGWLYCLGIIEEDEDLAGRLLRRVLK
jgi:hypothetical protein